jgi:hypothetical protein
LSDFVLVQHSFGPLASASEGRKAAIRTRDSVSTLSRLSLRSEHLVQLSAVCDQVQIFCENFDIINKPPTFSRSVKWFGDKP